MEKRYLKKKRAKLFWKLTYQRLGDQFLFWILAPGEHDNKVIDYEQLLYLILLFCFFYNGVLSLTTESPNLLF